MADIELSVRENLTAVEHIKRHTTLGMSVDQGKLGQAPAIEVIARARRLKPSELGHTTFRPPFVPVTLGTLVGRKRRSICTRRIEEQRCSLYKRRPERCSRISASGNDPRRFLAPGNRVSRP